MPPPDIKPKDIKDIVDAKDISERLQRGADSKKSALKAAGEATDLAMNAESATNKNLTQEERDAATKEAYRKGGRLGAKGAGAAAGVVGGGAASFGAEAADTLNVKSAQILNKTGISEKMGYNDMEALTDIAADKASELTGKHFQEKGMKIRDKIGEEGKLHETAQFAGQGVQAGLEVAEQKSDLSKPQASIGNNLSEKLSGLTNVLNKDETKFEMDALFQDKSKPPFIPQANHAEAKSKEAGLKAKHEPESAVKQKEEKKTSTSLK